MAKLFTYYTVVLTGWAQKYVTEEVRILVNISTMVGDISLSFDFALLSMSSRPKPAVNKLKIEDQNHFFVYCFGPLISCVANNYNDPPIQIFITLFLM